MDEGLLKKKLSPLNVCSLAFGCIIGWGAFVMPGNTFLPQAGPIGATIAIGCAAIIMLIIAFNYSYMVNKFPSSGGECLYAKEAFGKTHTFICTWFLGLSYLSIVPLNATALTLLARNLMGDLFQRGFHYQVAGYDIYFGELFLGIAVLVVFAIISIKGVKLTGTIQTILCFALVAGVLFVVVSATVSNEASWSNIQPGFSDEGNKLQGIIAVLAIAPWAFIGFDTVPQATEEFGFSTKKTKFIMAIAIIFGAGVYIVLNLITAMVVPEGYTSWSDYISDLDNLEGLLALPTFHAAYKLLGNVGLAFMGIAVLGAILSGITGFYMATSRLLYALSREKYLPSKFGKLHKKNNTPVNAILFILVISVFASFFGRTVIGWIVDMSSLGAAIGYGYTSAATVYFAKKERKCSMMITGVLGVLFSVCFAVLLIVPIPILGCSLSKEAYICLLIWTILGIAFFYFTSKEKDTYKN